MVLSEQDAPTQTNCNSKLKMSGKYKIHPHILENWTFYSSPAHSASTCSDRDVRESERLLLRDGRGRHGRLRRRRHHHHHSTAVHTHCAIIQKRLLYGHHPKDAGGVTVTHHCVKSFQVVRAATTRQHSLVGKKCSLTSSDIGLVHQDSSTFFSWGPIIYLLL